MTCYTRAILDGADIVVMVHADNQYDPTLVSKMVRPIERGEADVVIGSRLLEDEAIAGGMPRWKWVGNRFLTWIENRAFRTGFSEFHTGYRAFSADILREIAFLRNSDGFVFDQEIFAQLVRREPACTRCHSRRATSSRPRASRSRAASSTGCARWWCSAASGSTRSAALAAGAPSGGAPAPHGLVEEQPELRAPRAG